MNSSPKLATKLVKNPLGIITIFVLFIEAVIGFTATSELLTAEHRTTLIAFIVVFPVLVFLCFLYLVIKHPGKLYGPGDYEDQSHFMEVLGMKVESAVEKSNHEAIAELAALDIELIPIWEARSLRRPEDSEKRLHLLAAWVERLEQHVDQSGDSSKASSMAALRQVYMEYLKHASELFGGVGQYEEIRNRVVKGLEAIRADVI